MHLGDYKAGDTIDFKFTTRDAGVPFTLAGSPAVSVYKSNSTTESTAGVTLTVDFDSRTGLNHVHITTGSDTAFYAGGTDFEVVITTGTVNSNSVVGEVVAHFSLSNRADANVVRSSTAQAGTTSSIQLDASASATNNLYNGLLVWIFGGTGAGQVRGITGYNGTTKQATVDRAFITAPDSTSTFKLLATDNPSVNSSLQVIANVPRVTIRSGTAQTGSSSTTIKLDSGASATNNLYNGDLITITGGTGLGQTRTIISYNGTTKVASVDKTWNTTPDNTSTFDIYASTTPVVFSDQGVAQAGASTTITLASTASASNSVYVGAIVTILAGTGSGQTKEITAYNGSTKVATVDSAWSVNPDTTSVYAVIPTASGVGNNPANQDVNVVTWAGGQVTFGTNYPLVEVGDKTGFSLTQTFPANFSSLSIDASGRVDVGKILGTASTGVAGYVGIDWSHINAPTATVALTNTTISSSQVVASVTGAVGSVTGSVGSVTGNVGGNVTGSVGSVVGGVTVTTNNDKTGYSLTQTFPTNFSSLSIDGSGRVDVGKILGTASAGVAGRVAVDSTIAVGESYSSLHGTATLGQLLHEINQHLKEITFTGTVGTVKRRDGSTTAMTFTLDDPTNPSSITRNS
jgi:hypothetical protein